MARPPVKRPDQLTKRQKMVMESLRAGHDVRLQTSAFSHQFTGYVRVYNASSRREELIPWYSIDAMIARGLVQLNGNTIESSTHVVLRDGE